MFVASGIGPYSGQAVHFQRFAPEQLPYAINRYRREADRHYRVLDKHLVGRDYIVGQDYSIVDMAAWGWSRLVPFVLGEEAWKKLPNVKRHQDEIAARPAAQRAVALKDRFTFKSGAMDEEARRHMFKHLAA